MRLRGPVLRGSAGQNGPKYQILLWVSSWTILQVFVPIDSLQVHLFQAAQLGKNAAFLAAFLKEIKRPKAYIVQCFRRRVLFCSSLRLQNPLLFAHIRSFPCILKLLPLSCPLLYRVFKRGKAKNT